ncbi:Beta-hexosaminidase [Vulgatibacter incomptus]|uniref:Beta-hexosaminidase n=2 Tax=Vulgatibacter incomptus TaxID=1391653 RepID=A0A0K1PHU5_9BACT|nr:beta-N-acetylhexosaminidase [Vulgatibacter incomptus]AKU93082.1 Beta-hexosaminidase [Vulgatibacter incomptus]
MSELEKAAAKLFCVGFQGLEGVPAELTELQRRGVAGAILFKRNVESPAQVAALTAELQARAGRPFLTSMDQEGGRVMRLREPFTPIPAMRVVGDAGAEGMARALGAAMGAELRVLGIDLDFAPVLDVDTNPDNPVIGDRSFSRDPAAVARLGAAMIDGLQGAGVAACGKHFPGHGDTAQDSHLELPRLPHALPRLEAVELQPFAAAIRAGVASIMTAHVIFEALDPAFPATMSRPSLDGILRDRLGFDGVVISDDLEMKAIADHFGIEDAVVRGVNAGVDLFLVCHKPALQHRAIDALIAAVERGDVSRDRLEQAGRRVDTLVARFARPKDPRPSLELLGCDAHRELVRRVEALAGAAPLTPGRDPTERSA